MTRSGAVAPAPGCYLGVLLPGRAVEVVAEVAGRVRAVEVRPGDAVTAGALVAVIAPDDLGHQRAVAAAALESAGSTLAAFEVEVRRLAHEHRRRLDLGDLVSREEVDAAAFELEAASRRREGAAAEVAAARARLAALDGELGRAEARAPFAGTVALRHVDAGAVVAAGAPLARLVGDGEPLVRFAVPPAAAAGLAPGAALWVEAAGSAAPRRATLLHVAPEVDAPSETVFVEARLLADGTVRRPAGSIVRVSPAAGPPPGCGESAARLTPFVHPEVPSTSRPGGDHAR